MKRLENEVERMKGKVLRGAVASMVCGSLLLGGAYALPTTTEQKSGVIVGKSAGGWVDASNLSEGYISAGYTGGKDVKIKIQITKDGGDTYTYDLNNQGKSETFVLSEGNGMYTIGIYENTSGSNYVKAYRCTISMNLRDDFLPFLYPNQYVNYRDNSLIVETSKQLRVQENTDFDYVKRTFDYVVDFFTYDYDKAANIQSGYLPNLDTIIYDRNGICFDYASMMSAMLRSQGIPCKLVVGYAGDVYHAWVEVYMEESGWLDNTIYAEAGTWKRLDPTFTSSGNRSEFMMNYVNNESNYQAKLYY